MKLELKNITHTFKEVTALQNLSCTIEDGELVSFLGPSGSGKSTLLNIIAGILQPKLGSVIFDNLDVTSSTPKERNIGFVFQNYALYPNLNVRKNVEFPLEALKIKKTKRAEMIEEIAKVARIEHLLKKRPSELSGGEQQRVAIARALVKKPQLLLLDEPFSNLDPRLSAEMRGEIRKIQRELKITTILVTHNQAEAMELSDRIAIISAGRILQMDNISSLYHDPQSKFCAQFLGDIPINTIEGNIEQDAFVSCDRQIVIPGIKLNDGIVSLCIRPENIQVVKGGGDIACVLEFVSDHGRELVLHTKIGENHIKFLTQAKDTEYKPQESVNIVFNRKAMLFFDAKTGGRKYICEEE